MFGNKKHKVRRWSLISLTALLLSACSKEYTAYEGNTQGTTYHIFFLEEEKQVDQAGIDNLLKEFDLSLSTYSPNSLISNINELEGRILIPKKDQFFIPCFSIAADVAEFTEGNFDPTLYPLMSAWGFRGEVENMPDSAEIDSIMQFVGWDKNLFRLDSTKRELQKLDQRSRLDFNAVAQGYAVEVVAEYLESFGVKNYFVEIGGELKVKGKNREGEAWKIGVDLPVEDNENQEGRKIGTILKLNSGAVATSGNYRKFIEKDGEKLVHTMHPKTGHPAYNRVLSATVLCEDAAYADALATALMVMGLDQAKSVADNWESKGISYVLIYADEEDKMKQFWSPKMRELTQ